MLRFRLCREREGSIHCGMLGFPFWILITVKSFSLFTALCLQEIVESRVWREGWRERGKTPVLEYSLFELNRGWRCRRSLLSSTDSYQNLPESILAEGASQIQISFCWNWAPELTFRRNTHRNAGTEWQPDFTGTESGEFFFFACLIITFFLNRCHIKLPSLPHHHHHPLSPTIFRNRPFTTPHKHDDYDTMEGQRGRKGAKGGCTRYARYIFLFSSTY